MHVISLYYNTSESNLKVLRIEEMITNYKQLLIIKQILLVSLFGNV